MHKANAKTALKGLIIIVVNTFLLGGCSGVDYKPSPTATLIKSTATLVVSPHSPSPVSTSTLKPADQNECTIVETMPSADFMLDGTVILGNLADQSIYILSNRNKNPQPLLGKNPSWNSNYHLSPDGKMLVDSILSDDGLRYTTLKIKSLNGDDVWEIPYGKDWSGVRGWINNEQIEMTKSDPAKSTTNPFTGTFAFNPFTKETSAEMDAADLNLKPATIPYYDPTMTRMIYVRDTEISESEEALVESVIIEEIDSGRKIWAREDLGRDYLIASWSANGNLVAIQDYLELTVINTDKGWDRELQRDNLEFDVSTFPVWSPDERYIAIKTYDSLAIYDPINDLLMDFCVHDQVLSFSWSPNSRQLAISGWLSDGSSYVLLINIETKIATRYVGSDFVLLGWAASQP